MSHTLLRECIRHALRNYGLAGASVALGCAAVSAQAQDTAPPRDNKSQALETIVVTGSNIRRVDIETSNPVITIDKAAIQLKLTKRLDASYRRATRETFSDAKASEAMTKSVEAYAKIAQLFDDAPKVTIAIGQAATSAVLDAIWGPAPLETITTEGTEVVTAEPAQLAERAGAEEAHSRTDSVPTDVDASAEVQADWR